MNDNGIIVLFERDFIWTVCIVCYQNNEVGRFYAFSKNTALEKADNFIKKVYPNVSEKWSF